jgi:hypothetical protein
MCKNLINRNFQQYNNLVFFIILQMEFEKKRQSICRSIENCIFALQKQIENNLNERPRTTT